ncbi:hypothetical protein PF003_g7597 [Phytophthora fragariae]|nr:hypothetical protein PF003_g7597 [Phytophthora fragariae]
MTPLRCQAPPLHHQVLFWMLRVSFTWPVETLPLAAWAFDPDFTPPLTVAFGH